MYKNKTAVSVAIVAVFAFTSVAFAGLTTSAGVDSKTSTISTPSISTSKPSVGVVSTGVTTQTTATTDAIIARSAFISADYVTPGTFNSAAGTGGDYGFPGNIFLAPTTNASSGVIYKGAVRFIHNFHQIGDNDSNIFIGKYSGNFTMTGNGGNVAVGYSTLVANTTGTYNVAIGYNSLMSNTTGDGNTANGTNSLLYNTTGAINTANGNESLFSNTTGSFNTANGGYSLSSNTTGSFNTANGGYSLRGNTTGARNTAIGYFSGDNGGFLNTMTNSTFLGYGADSSIDGITNSMALGAGSQVTKSNQVVIGNTAVTETLLRGKVKIGNRICIWNGASYTSMSFAPNSVVPVYATSTSC